MKPVNTLNVKFMIEHNQFKTLKNESCLLYFSYYSGNKIFHIGGTGTNLPVECWEFAPGNTTTTVEISIHQTKETMHYWYPYAYSFIIPSESVKISNMSNDKK